MKFLCKVKSSAKINKVEKMSENELCLWVKAPAVEGKANKQVVAILSEYFNIPRSRITLLRGEKSKIKIVEII